MSKQTVINVKEAMEGLSNKGYTVVVRVRHTSPTAPPIVNYDVYDPVTITKAKFNEKELINLYKIVSKDDNKT